MHYNTYLFIATPLKSIMHCNVWDGEQILPLAGKLRKMTGHKIEFDNL